MADSIVRMASITKPCRSVPRVKNADFDLTKGGNLALLDENGAGTAPLTRVMAGAVEEASGKMFHNGREIVFASPNGVLEAGVAMVFQETHLVPLMAVA